MHIKIANVLLITCLVWYGLYQRNEAREFNEIAVNYYDKYCSTEALLAKANPSDPIVLEFQRNAKENKICDGYMLYY